MILLPRRLVVDAKGNSIPRGSKRMDQPVAVFMPAAAFYCR